MAFSGREYADRVRELRESGFDFPASRGYVLRNAANWNAGQKAAVTRAYNQLDDDFGDDFPTDDESIPDVDLGEADREAFFDDAAGDDFEEWDDIDFFDYDEAEEFDDEESDTYAEDT
jgi:hypothetical protein